jgi:isoamylase
MQRREAMLRDLRRSTEPESLTGIRHFETCHRVHKTGVGRSFPIGATLEPGGINFCVYSKTSTRLELLLFDSIDSEVPSEVIDLDPKRNRTFHYWHTFVFGLQSGQVYAYRAHGPFQPSRGHRFDGEKVLLDPYGRSVWTPASYDRRKAILPGGNLGSSMKSVAADLSLYDWEGDEPPSHPYSETVIYEMHVGGFTRHPSSGVPPERRGTYAGLVDKIPYLQELGVTAVELMPVFQFDVTEAPLDRTNYWGYNPVSVFAPHRGYSSRKDLLGPMDEFRDMVKALHRAGIEVLLDVVYNHTAEGDATGPTFCLKGLENSAYYILGKSRDEYANYTGTGNTLNANHSVVRRLILDSLRYWVEVMHVDGFRFDLASILSRDDSGQPLANPPVLWEIETDPVLAHTKLIAEAWDAAGLYQVGSFIGDRWKEWNGRFRDDVRSFVKGDPGMAKTLSNRFLASPDIFVKKHRESEQTINFVTCHDGFTVNDLVSYNDKHNEANNEGNTDGNNHNLSWNCGVEGPVDDPSIEALRNRQVKNLLAINLLSLGTPMLLMGDEARRSQGGNNNAYCQDNEVSWFDWSLLQRHADVHRFVRRVIGMRKNLSVVLPAGGEPLAQLLEQARIDWHGVRLFEPDVSHGSRSLAMTFRGVSHVVHIVFNAYWEALDFELPPVPVGEPAWRRLLDTALPAPDDVCEPHEAKPLERQDIYRAEARTVVLLGRELRRL